MLLVIKTPSKIISTTLTVVKTLTGLTLLNALDFVIFTLNLFLPRKAKGSVVAKGDAGYGGIWPAFVAPSPGDSRSPCPYLSAFFSLYLSFFFDCYIWRERWLNTECMVNRCDGEPWDYQSKWTSDLDGSTSTRDHEDVEHLNHVDDKHGQRRRDPFWKERN